MASENPSTNTHTQAGAKGLGSGQYQFDTCVVFPSTLSARCDPSGPNLQYGTWDLVYAILYSRGMWRNGSIEDGNVEAGMWRNGNIGSAGTVVDERCPSLLPKSQ